ncbi:MAG: integrase [Alteromonadaceae bacterium]|jgi:integrase
MPNKQLFIILPEYRNISFIGKDHVPTINVIKDFPFMSMPNGVPCVMANKYLIEASKKIKSGTIKQYASGLSSLIRYCFDNKVDFIDLTSDNFSELVIQHREELTQRLTPKRTSNTTINNGRRWLDFLDFVGKEYEDADFLESRIWAKKKVVNIRIGGKMQNKMVWWHSSLATASPLKKREPISIYTINSLHKAIKNVTDNKFIIRRYEVLLRLLECTGARISELSTIKVSNLLEALDMQKPMIKLETKKNDKGFRYIPVLHQDLRQINKFIHIHRTPLINKALGSHKDNDFLFVDAKTGKNLTSKYLSDEIGKLRRVACIKEKACAHMFRHRFITKLFMILIAEFNASNKSELRTALLDINIFKKKVQQYTNHANLESLDHYIDLAFSEMADVEKTVDKVRQRQVYETFDRELEKLTDELKQGMPIAKYLEELSTLYQARESDLIDV